MNKTVQFFIAIGLGMLLFSQFYILYSGNFDRLMYEKSTDWMSLLLILLTIPVSITAFCWIVFEGYEKLQAVTIYLGFFSIIVNGPGYGYYLYKHEAECYTKQGVRTWGTVTESFRDHRRMYYDFSIGNVRYTSANVLNPLKHSVGDSVAVIYNAKCPDMNSAVENL